MGHRSALRTHTWIVAAVAATILAAAIPEDRTAGRHARTGLLAIGLLTVLGAAVDVLATQRSNAGRAAGSADRAVDDDSRRAIHATLRRQQELCDELARRLDEYAGAFGEPSRARDEVFLDLRRQVAELRCENHRLIDLDRARDEFVAVAAHELKTPLTAMTSHLEILRHYGAGLEAEQRDESLAVLSHEAARVSRLIDELLELARVRSGRTTFEPRLFDARDVVRSVHRSLSPLADERSLRLLEQVPGIVLRAFADPSRVEQILTNLVANAIKYTPAQGSIAIDGNEDDENVFLAVSDDGPGIDPEERELVFEAFYRGRRHGSIDGSGIGLHLSREIARRMRGDLTIEDSPGGGARFVLRLPREPETRGFERG